MDTEIIIKETEFGIKVIAPALQMRVEVANTVSNYLRARQFIFLVSCGALQGTVRDAVEFFEQAEE
jgi:fructoselysine-6-P-deglycase FrlB-like protein